MERQFWHLQLHAEKRLSDEMLQKIVKEKSVIGMAASWLNKRGEQVRDPERFQNEMQIGDVVLIRSGRRPIALVEVVGSAFLTEEVDLDLDWFPLRRKIKLWGFYKGQAEDILQQSLSQYGKKQIQALGTLTLCSRPTATKEFIRNWWEACNLSS